MIERLNYDYNENVTHYEGGGGGDDRDKSTWSISQKLWGRERVFGKQSHTSNEKQEA